MHLVMTVFIVFVSQCIIELYYGIKSCLDEPVAETGITLILISYAPAQIFRSECTTHARTDVLTTKFHAKIPEELGQVVRPCMFLFSTRRGCVHKPSQHLAVKDAGHNLVARV